MKEHRNDPKTGSTFRADALAASLILHGIIIALLVYGLPKASQQPQQDQAINVALVPSPDQPEPKPVPAPPSDEATVEQPPQPETQPPPEPASIEVLKPVFQFGEKDSGPRQSPDGNSAQERPASPADNDGPEPPAAAPTIAAAPDDDAGIALPPAVAAPMPRPAHVPKPRSGNANGANGATGATGASSTDLAAAAPQRDSDLPGVRRLASQAATGDALATTSMASIPRGKRAATLCASELQQQLQSASYFPDLVPMISLKEGNVLDVPETAFHAGTAWYNLSFRCEVDSDATKVLSFAFQVGSTIPREEWARRGLPGR